MSKPLMTVTWNDANSSSTLVYEEARDHKPIVMHTVGWVLRRDKTGISIAGETYTEDGTERHRGWTFIPSGMVVSVRKAK